MKKLSEKGRKVLRMVYRCLGVTAVSFIFQACYGMPTNEPGDDDIMLRGTVLNKKTYKPIPGISVWVKDINRGLTGYDGTFTIRVPIQDIQDNYTFVFSDIDGPDNGSFQGITMNVPAEELYSQIIVPMEEVAE